MAAIATAQSLIARGIKPVVLDWGDKLPETMQSAVDRMSITTANEWLDSDTKVIFANNSIVDKKQKLPKKFVFGSDYFYGDASRIYNNTIDPNNVLPPFSLAYGGFSAGWGGAALPADDCDLQSWPIKRNALQNYYEEILKNVPFSAQEDELAEHFPLYCVNNNPLKLAAGNASLLQTLRSNYSKLKNLDVVFGQARVLTQAQDSEKGMGCQYCGHCMSGCVYKSMYKSNAEFDALISKGLVDYIAKVFVDYVVETEQKVTVYFTDANNVSQYLVFDRVFLAAGAIGSARIILQSKKLYNKDVPVLTTASFLAPVLQLKRSRFEWPHVNTQPAVFLEFKVPHLSNHWIHTQISTTNELLFQKLGLFEAKDSFFHRCKKRLMEHVFIAMCNLHSDHGVGHKIRLDNNNLLISSLNKPEAATRALKLAARKFFSIGRLIGCYVLLPFIQTSISNSSNHLGGSLPMRENPLEETDTNILGNPVGFLRTHVVDSSVFPSIPGTTIGLLAMANAKRIVDRVVR